MSAAPAREFRITGRHVLAAMIAFFTVIIGLDVMFATLAYRTFSGQAAKNPYEAGLLYNRTLADRRAELRLGWRSEIAADDGQLVLRLADSGGAPLSGLQVRATLIRPATEVGSRTLDLLPAGDGRYAADIASLSGAWDVLVQVEQRGVPKFRAEQRINLQ